MFTKILSSKYFFLTEKYLIQNWISILSQKLFSDGVNIKNNVDKITQLRLVFSKIFHVITAITYFFKNLLY